LSYLRKFPLDALKVDQSFVRQLSNSGSEAAIVIAVISMARSLKLRVIAEGIETQAELDFLRAHQCDEAQGYYFSEPIPADKFMEVLRHGLARTAAPGRLGLRAQIGRESATADAAVESMLQL
jgi:diguanylate cyclase